MHSGHPTRHMVLPGKDNVADSYAILGKCGSQNNKIILVMFQIGFVLYPLSGPEWDLTRHDNIMFITMCFCWHLAVALLIMGICYCGVFW